jgi:hypothetical protein
MRFCSDGNTGSGGYEDAAGWTRPATAYELALLRRTILDAFQIPQQQLALIRRSALLKMQTQMQMCTHANLRIVSCTGDGSTVHS